MTKRWMLILCAILMNCGLVLAQPAYYITPYTTDFARQILADANEAEFKATVNLEEGTDYLGWSRLDDTKGNGDTGYVWSADKMFDQLALKQAADSDLTTWAGLTPSAFFQTLVNDANAATAQATLGLVIGTNVQAYDADLGRLASADTSALTNGQLLIGNTTSNVWGLGTLTAGTGMDVTNGASAITIDFDSTEIGTTTWGNSAGMVWTMNGEGAIDQTLTFGNGLLTLSHDLTVLGSINAGKDGDMGDMAVHHAGTLSFLDSGDDTQVTLGPVGDGTTVLGMTGTLNATGLQIGGVAVVADPNVTAFAGLPGTADTVPYFTGPGAMSTATSTSFGRTQWGVADANHARPNLELPVINVKDHPYEAANDGVTDATTGVDAAIDAALATKNAVVYFPAGRYLLSTWAAVTIVDANVAIVGAGADKTFIIGPGEDSNVDFLEVRDDLSIRNVTIKSFESILKMTTLATTIERIDIQDTVFTDMEYGLNFLAVDGGYQTLTAHNCVFSNGNEGMYLIPKVMGDTIITDCVFRDMSYVVASGGVRGIWYGVDTTPSDNRNRLTVQGCSFINLAGGAATETHGVMVHEANDVVITANHFRNISRATASDCEGVYIRDVNHAVVSANTFVDVNSSEGVVDIKVACADAVVSDNIIQTFNSAMVVTGIGCYTNYATIQGNHLSGCTRNGIVVSNNTSSQGIWEIRDNWVLDTTGKYGIVVYPKYRRASIVGNHVIGVTGADSTGAGLGTDESAAASVGIYLCGSSLDGNWEHTVANNLVSGYARGGTARIVNGIQLFKHADGDMTQISVIGNKIAYVNTGLVTSDGGVNLLIHGNTVDDASVAAYSLGTATASWITTYDTTAPYTVTEYAPHTFSGATNVTGGLSASGNVTLTLADGQGVMLGDRSVDGTLWIGRTRSSGFASASTKIGFPEIGASGGAIDFYTNGPSTSALAARIDENQILNAYAGLTVANGSASAGFLDLSEDSDNGTNRLRLLGPAILASDVQYVWCAPGAGYLKSDASGNLSIDTPAGAGDFLADGSVPMTAPLFLNEVAAAAADQAGKGQIWVKNTTPNELWFTDDAGTDFQLGTSGAGDITSVWSDDSGDVSALTAAEGDTLDATNADSTVPWKVNATAAPTVEGQAIWESDADTLRVGDGAATLTFAMTRDKLSVFAATSSAELAGVLSDEQGTGVAVYSDSPTFVDDISVAAAGVKLTGSDGALTILGLGDGFDEDLKIDLDTTENTGTVTSSTGLATLNFSSIALQESGNAVPNATDKLSFFGATTSAELAGVISNETGSGGTPLLVFNQSPVITTPSFNTYAIVLGASDTPATAPLFDLRRERDGDPTQDVSDDDVLGELRYRGYKTDGYYEGAIIRGVVDGTPGASDMPSRLEFATSADGSATPTTRLTIDSTGLATFAGAVTSGGTITSSGTFDVTGAAGMTFGSADVTGMTFTTGATGNANWTMPADSIGDDDIDWGSGAGQVEITAAKMAAAAKTVGINFVIDGGGSEIADGVELWVEAPFTFTITSSRLLADTSGAIVVDIWKDTYANYPPTDADTITSATPPTIAASGVKSEDTTLTKWTTTVTAGDIIKIHVDSCTSITKCTLSLCGTK